MKKMTQADWELYQAAKLAHDRGATPAEIAQDTGVSISVVHRRISKARRHPVWLPDQDKERSELDE